LLFGKIDSKEEEG